MDQQVLDEAFFQARLKVDRANRHVREAHDWFAAYLKSDFCRLRLETNASKTFQGVYVDSEPIPHHLVLSIGDAFHCLNTALDYVASGMMRAAGADATRVSFPSHDSRKALRKSFMAPRRNRGTASPCTTGKKPANRRVVETFPSFALMLLQKIKPYRGGDFGVWEVRKADNIDKHNLIIPSVVIAEIRGIELFDKRYNNRITTGGRVGAGGRLNMIAYGNPIAGLEIQNKGEAAASISFSETMEVFAGEPVFPTLIQSVQLIAQVLDIIEGARLKPRIVKA